MGWVAHLEVLEHDVEVALDDAVGQVAHEGRVGRLVRQRPLPAAAAAEMGTRYRVTYWVHALWRMA